MSILRAWTDATTHFGLRLQHVTPDHFTRPTPCENWTIHELIDHVFDVQTRAPAALGHPPSRRTANSTQEWQALCEQVLATVTAETLSCTVETGLGPMTASDMLHIATADCLTHTWDLARALQLDEQLPVEAVDLAFRFMGPLDELLRAPAMLGPKLDPPPGADQQARFLSFAGRPLDWAPRPTR